jgi:hypothetical protein
MRLKTIQASAFGASVALLMLATARPLAAQDPNAPNVTGRVASVAGFPVPGVEVRIDGTNRTVQTDNDGAYRFVGAPKGVHTLRFRRIGYLPAAVAVNIPDITDSVRVLMVPSRQSLDTVKVTAHAMVVAGIVVDEMNHPVPGATIDVIGSAKLNATADDGGWFSFTSVHNGPIILRARKEGYAFATHSLDLEDSRGIVLHMQQLPKNLSESKTLTMSGFGNTESYVWGETQQRLARRDMRSTIVPREELAAYGNMPLGDAIRQSDAAANIRADLIMANDQACVLEDGHRMVGYTSLNSFNSDDVDFVELYPPGTEPTGTVARYLRNAGCRTMRSGINRGPFFAVIWIRA